MATRDYIIAIPSYKRNKLIQEKTLKLLKQYKIPNKIIFIFVANTTEYKLYLNTIPKDLYYKIIIGKKSLKHQRNLISSYFKEGQQIVQLDDDLEDIVQLFTDKKKPYLKSISNLDKFIQKAFQICLQKKSYIWGVYPLANAYFMNTSKHYISTNLKFIVGPMWGIINRHDKDLKTTINEKEDTERTIKYYIKDNVVVRFNHISIKTNYYKNTGGMQSENKNRKAEAMKSALYLTKKYPNYTRLDLSKKSGFPEVRLNHNKKIKTKKTKKRKN